MARKRLGTDIVVFMTQDAYPRDSDIFSPLVEPIIKGIAAVSYARQIPREGAGTFEAFPREFNYGPTPQLRRMDDVDTYGVYTFFCSNG